jgi:hypothetical protein
MRAPGLGGPRSYSPPPPEVRPLGGPRHDPGQRQEADKSGIDSQANGQRAVQATQTSPSPDSRNSGNGTSGGGSNSGGGGGNTDVAAPREAAIDADLQDKLPQRKARAAGLSGSGASNDSRGPTGAIDAQAA